MNEPIYLLTGVTGATGGAAARELRKQGCRVRGLVHKDDARAEALRTLGIETIVGDLLDLDSLRRAMEGVAGAYFVYPFSDGLIDAAAFTAPGGDRGRRSVARQHVAEIGTPRSQEPRRARPLGERTSV